MYQRVNAVTCVWIYINLGRCMQTCHHTSTRVLVLILGGTPYHFFYFCAHLSFSASFVNILVLWLAKVASRGICIIFDNFILVTDKVFDGTYSWMIASQAVISYKKKEWAEMLVISLTKYGHAHIWSMPFIIGPACHCNLNLFAKVEGIPGDISGS